MRSALVRFLAAVVLVGQLQQLPGAAYCVLGHEEQATECEESGVSSAGTLCAAVGPCAPAVPAVAPSAAVAWFVDFLRQIGAPRVAGLDWGVDPVPLLGPPRV